MKILTYTTVLALFASILIGCKAKTVYVPIEALKVEYRDRLERDSIYIKDSVIINHKGDTIFIEKYRYIYKDKLVRDTINVTDSIQVPYAVVEYKETNRLSSFQSFQVWCGRVLLLLLLSYLGFNIIRKSMFR